MDHCSPSAVSIYQNFPLILLFAVKVILGSLKFAVKCDLHSHGSVLGLCNDVKLCFNKAMCIIIMQFNLKKITFRAVQLIRH